MEFVYKAPQSSRWYNANFTIELEEEIRDLRDQYLSTEFVLLADMKSHMGTMQVNLPHTHGTFLKRWPKNMIITSKVG
jgi:hypothetical protein